MRYLRNWIIKRAAKKHHKQYKFYSDMLWMAEQTAMTPEVKLFIVSNTIAELSCYRRMMKLIK